MFRRPPDSTRPGILFPYTARFRSYVSVSGFGEVGPYSRRPAYDMMIQGLTGFMPTQGSRDNPVPVRTTLADRVTAMWASHAALAALLHRERTGAGQKRSEEHTSELQSLMRISYAVFCLKKKI